MPLVRTCSHHGGVRPEPSAREKTAVPRTNPRVVLHGFADAHGFEGNQRPPVSRALASDLPSHARISKRKRGDSMDAILNLALFVGVFYLINLLAGLPDRWKTPAAPRADPAKEKRVA
jgi:hypothetical protein